MRVQDKTGRRTRLLLALALLMTLGILAQFSLGAGPGPNYRNYTVDTRVNITGSPPYVTAVTLQDPITLTPGSLTEVTCNVSIRDYNSFGELDTVNATLFAASSNEYSADDNNTHYTNSSCNPISGQQSGYFANYSCSFKVNYYAVNGTWNCTARVNDSKSLTGFGTDNTTLYPLYALNVTEMIDYGDMIAGEYSSNKTANITNIGNLPINITVQGYGNSSGDGLSFSCEIGNLTVDLQRFAANSTADYNTKQVLSNSYQQIAGLTVPKANDSTVALNTTYWELYVDPAQEASGQCNGTLIFQAEPM
jgi:hypothetical protein